MYFKSAHITNFQSIADLEIEFAPGLTTIVGQSSTGKSAILRALRTLAHNTSRPQVRAGKTALTVSATLHDGTVVGVERGKSKSTYVIGDEQYTKAGVSVPDPVSKVLRLTGTDPDAHFSFQFDKPYLLAETGSTISTVLGRLTQAHILREAVREGARLAQQHSSLAKTRRTDVVTLAERLKTEFTDIPAKRAALARATELGDQAEKKFSRSATLLTLVGAVEEKATRVTALQAVVPVDRSDALTDAEARLARSGHLLALAKAVEAATERLEQAEVAQRLKQQTVDAVTEKYTEVLHSLGVCPTCGQDTTNC